MKVLIFLGLILFAFAEKRVEEESIHLDCINKGPNYWCENEVTAEKCHAVKYCKKYIWSKEEVSPNTDTCMYCQEFANTLHMLLDNKATQAEVVAGLKMFCSLLPDSTKTMCAQMVDTYGQQIVDEILKYTADAKSLCTMIDLCSADCKRAPIDNGNFMMMKKVILDKVFGDYCIPCKRYIVGLHSLTASKKIKSDLVGAMKKMCRFLPTTLSTWCPGMVDEYGEKIVDSFLEYTSDPSRPCATVGLCKNRDVHPLLVQIPEEETTVKKQDYVKFSPVESVSTDVCTYCQQIIGTFHMLLENTGTQTEIIAGLDAICAQIPGVGKTICDEFVQIYGKEIIKALLDYTKDPRNFCAAVHLCSSNSERVLPTNFLLLRKVIKDKVFGDYCIPCKQHIHHVHSLTSSLEMKSDLVAGMRSACQFLPKGIQSWCVGMVDAKGLQIIDSFIEYTRDPSLFCATVFLCKNRDVVPVTPAKSQVLDLKASKICTYCQEVVGTVRMMLTNNKTTEEIIAGLEMACNSIPGVGKLVCEELVQVYGKTIIKDVLEYTKDPRKLCTLIHLCSSNQKKVNTLKNQIVWKGAVKEPNGPTCDFCLFGIGYLQKMLGSNKTEASIKAKLEKWCEVVPEYLRQSCKTMVDKYEDQIIHLIIAETEPKIICHEIGLCKDSAKKAVLAPQIGISCSICEYGVQLAYISLADKPTQQRIKFALMLLCTKIPSKQVQAECTSIITNYFDEILNALLTELKNPKLLCEAVKCVNSNEKAFYLPKGMICDTCVQGVTYAAKLLESEKIKKLFLSALDHVCGMTPFPDQCKEYATKYEDVVFKFLDAQFKEPKKLCQKLHLCCSSKEGQNSKTPITAVKSGVFCEACEIAVPYISNYLSTNETKSTIKSYLLQVCHMLPIPSLVGECDTLVKQDYDTIYTYVLQQLSDPAVLCQELEFCTSAGKSPALKTSIAPIKDTPLCAACEFAAKLYASYLSKPETKAQVKSAILGACSALPSTFASECQSLVNQNFDKFYNMVLQQWQDAKVMCQALHLCAASGKELTMVRDGAICEICEIGAKYLATYMNNTETKSEIKSALLSVCGQFPSSIGSECTTYVNQYFELAYSFLLQQIANPLNLCQELKLCSTSVKKVSDLVLPKTPDNVVSCELCELMLNKLDSMLNGSRLEDDVKGALKKLCDDLPYKSQCNSLVNKYSGKIVDLLVNQLKHPEHVCTLMGLCGSVLKAEKSKNSFTCAICDATLSELGIMLQDSHKRELVVKALQHVCARLPKHLNTECNDLVEYYTPQILKHVAEELKEPKHFCKDLKFCKAKAVTKIARKPSKNGAVTCEICEFVIGELLQKFKGKETEEEIKEELLRLCKRLPYVEKQCEHVVEKYSEKIIDMIIGGVGDAHAICKKLHYCSTRKSITHPKVQPKKNDVVVRGDEPASCSLCMFMTGKLDVYLKNSPNKKVVKKTIKSICTRAELTGENLDACKRMMDEYKDEIIKLAKNSKIPSFCKRTGQCVSPHAMGDYATGLGIDKSGTLCLACEYLVGVLDTYLSKKATKAKIIADVHILCNRSPRAIFTNECNALIDEYGEEIIQLFADNALAPVSMCKSLHVC